MSLVCSDICETGAFEELRLFSFLSSKLTFVRLSYCLTLLSFALEFTFKFEVCPSPDSQHITYKFYILFNLEFK